MPIHVPTRTCLGCRAACPASELVRLVLTAQGIGVAARSAGRGAWLHPRAECVKAAVKTRAFSRAFRQTVNFSETDDLMAALTAAQPRRWGGQNDRKRIRT
jgi:predicted RNA-binding protein YlxR (DUF448 family)